VIVVAAEADALAGRLEELAAQSVSPGTLEVVVVLLRPAPEVDADPEPFTHAYCGLQVRAFGLTGTSVATGRNVGLRVARGRHCLFVDERTSMAPGVVAGLLAQAGPGVVPVAALEADQESADARLLRVFADPGARLVPTELARTVRYDASLGQGADFAYWLELWARTGCEFGLVGGGGAEAAPDRATSYDDVLSRLDLIGHLGRLVSPTPPVRALIDKAVHRTAEAIRDFLARHPERHAEVVAQVHAREIRNLPWDVVNNGLARDLAILYCFLPSIDTSALVAARRLRERGVVTDVISQNLSHLRRIDDSSVRIVEEIIDESRVLPGRRRFGRWSAVRGFVEETLANVAELEAAKGPYASVYSRAMAVHSHFAAAILKLRSPEIRWVAEFSDPIFHNAYGDLRLAELKEDWLHAELAAGLRRAGYAVPEGLRLYEWDELIVYALADEIIFTNQHQLDFMLGYAADRELATRAAGVSRVSHHPVPDPALYDAAHPAYELDPARVHLGYFGNFDLNRDLTDIAGALNGLTVAERAKVQLHVFTTEVDKLRLDTLERGLADVVTVHPMFGYLAYLNLITRFDVLLINDYATSPHYVPNPYLPAKLADYLGSGSQIWAMYEAGSVLSTVPVDYASELGDAAASADVLRQVIRAGHVATR
jgi:hypothetical protein